MKLLSTLFAVLAFGTCFAQSATQESEHKNPPSMAELELTVHDRAEIQAFEIMKACEIHDKVDINAVVQACYEFELDLSMESIRNSEEEMTRITERMDNAIRQIVGSQKMAAYNTWKERPKPYSTDNYVD